MQLYLVARASSFQLYQLFQALESGISKLSQFGSIFRTEKHLGLVKVPSEFHF